MMRHAKLRRLLFVSCAVLLVSACGTTHIRDLREAQDTFSQASDRHNHDVLSSLEPLRGSSAEAVSGFRIAERMTASLIETKRSDLAKDNLLCTAFVIQAMSLWKLGDNDAAVAVARGSDGCAPDEKARARLARENAILRAIPGLVRIDQASALMTNGKLSVDEYVRARSEILLALTDLREAGGSVGADHPVRTYLLTSSVAGVRVWQYGASYKGLTASTDPDRDRMSEQKRVRGVGSRYLGLLGYHLQCQMYRPAEEVQRQIAPWQALFQISTLDAVACDKPAPDDTTL